MADLPSVRIGYAGENPPPWKATGTITDTDFPTGASYLESATRIPILALDNVELRERRLVIDLRSNATPEVASFIGTRTGFRCGMYGFTSGAGSTQIGCYARRGNIGLRITCTGYTNHVLECDARPGVYRIPPSTAIRVEALASRVDAAAFANAAAVQVQAEVVDSCEGPVNRPIQSTLVNVLTTDYFALELNPYARWIDFGASNETPADAGAAILVGQFLGAAVAPNMDGPTILRDYVNVRWFPTGDPVELLGASSYENDTSRPSFRITNSGTNDARVMATQYLEW